MAMVLISKQLTDKLINTRTSVTLLTLAETFTNIEEYEAADQLYDEIIKRNEKDFRCRAYLGKGLNTARPGGHERAIELYRQAIELATDDTDVDKTIIYYHIAISLHSIGKYREGWEYLWDCRLHNTNYPVFHRALRRFPTKPIFNWQPAPARILIHAEAGEGDNFAFMRYLPMLRDKGYQVSYEAKFQTVTLAQNSLEGIEVGLRSRNWPEHENVNLDYVDYHLPIIDLPYIFETDIDTVPWNGPYIKAHPELVDKYKEHRGKIGVVWASAPTGGVWMDMYANYKSVPFEQLRPLLETNPDRFVSLQVGSHSQDNDIIEYALPHSPIWAETAALMENLDAIITVDTGPAHLAGAMGKKTYLMMHAVNNGWHFMCERPNASWNTRSPWYPTMKIFRQKEPGNWTNVIADLSLAIRE